MQYRYLFALLLLSLTAFACNKKKVTVASKPDWVISEDKMVDIIVDLRIVDAATYSNNSGAPRDKAKDWYRIMKKHHVEDSIFRNSHDYYCYHQKVLANIYERVIDRLSEMEAENAEAAGLVDTLRNKPQMR